LKGASQSSPLAQPAMSTEQATRRRVGAASWAEFARGEPCAAPGQRHNPGMNPPALDHFIAQAVVCSRQQPEPADCVLALAPLMLDLIEQAGSFLQAQHLQGSAVAYTRNLVYDAPDRSLSLYAIVWLPGQWTPVHDHGSWGVVGVVEGVLEERSYVRLSPDRGADDGIELARGGTVLLNRGAVTSFVPNPDHIHITGVPAERPRAVSLHLYGRTMSDFNLYDVVAGTRRRIRVAHNES
jgi:predicted metal-dependent enzyme (double-stranded beta helix superfamily)